MERKTMTENRTEAFEALFSAMAHANGVGAFSDDAEAFLAALEASGWQLVPTGVAEAGRRAVEAHRALVAQKAGFAALYMKWARHDRMTYGPSACALWVEQARKVHRQKLQLLKDGP